MIEDLQNLILDKSNLEFDLAGGLFDSCHHYQVIVRLHRQELLKMIQLVKNIDDSPGFDISE